MHENEEQDQSRIQRPTLINLHYGCGIRISECLRLRVKDIDFDQMLIEIHNAKGDKSRFALVTNK